MYNDNVQNDPYIMYILIHKGDLHFLPWIFAPLQNTLNTPPW